MNWKSGIVGIAGSVVNLLIGFACIYVARRRLSYALRNSFGSFAQLVTLLIKLAKSATWDGLFQWNFRAIVHPRALFGKFFGCFSEDLSGLPFFMALANVFLAVTTLLPIFSGSDGRKLVLLVTVPIHMSVAMVVDTTIRAFAYLVVVMFAIRIFIKDN